MANLEPWASEKIYPEEGQRRHSVYHFQAADDEIQIDVHKTLYPC